jgi:[protein-PII] uridylyltransferase
MTTAGSGMRASVVRAKSTWLDGRELIRQRHQAGVSGVEVTRAMSDLLDSVLLGIYQTALEEISPALVSRIALVLLGGCGRQDIAPYSDIDLMLLYQGSITDDIVEFSRRISQDITDTGMQLGYSMRTPRDACGMSLRDAYVFSSLTEARFLEGNRELFEYFQGRFKRISKRRTNDIIRAIIQARELERAEFGETVYLLRPNLKKSRGGLRDIHLIRWLGYVQYFETDIDCLLAAGGLSTADSTQLKLSREFLLRLRNEMHFHAGHAQDRLGRNEQVRLAELFDYPGDDAMLSVESFMRDYFRYTSRISYVCDHFVSKSISRKKGTAAAVLGPLVARQIDHHFRMGPTQIGVINSSLDMVKMDLEQVLRLMQLACLHDKKIEHETWITIRHAMLKFPDIPFTREAARRFMALLSNSRGLAELLYRLHEMQVLKKIIPGFDHARGLLQFNEYHMYTVDEHSLRAVAMAIEFDKEQSVVGRTYQQIREKNVLHLALLLHDLGKGFTEDHSEVGRRIAEQTGHRLDLSDEAIEDIKFLVHNHLVMSHLAFHRDINDPSLVAEFASNVGSVHLLNMLYVLTCADISAVGHGVLSPWKLGLLTDLYLNAKKILTGDAKDVDLYQASETFYEAVSAFGEDEKTRHWLRNTASNLPDNYFSSHVPETIANQLLALKETASEDALCWVNPIEGTALFELCIAKVASRRSGIFYKLTGILTSLGLRIRAADIKLLNDSSMFYWIRFEDAEFSETPASRLDHIQSLARDLAQGIDESPPRFRSVWTKQDSRALRLSRPPIQVKIDNQTVDTATIIDVFAYDKPGLLYKIVKKIFRLGLDVTYARIATYAHQVIDVFYVTDELGNKIRNKNQIQLIRKEILAAVAGFLKEDEKADNESEE